MDGFRAAQNRVRSVVLIKRRKHNDLVPRIACSHHRDHHGFSASARDHDIFLRINFHPHEPRLLSRQRRTKVRRSPSHRILMRSHPRRSFRGLQNHFRRIEIRITLRKIDRAALIREPRHPANHRLSKLAGAITSLRHEPSVSLCSGSLECSETANYFVPPSSVALTKSPYCWAVNIGNKSLRQKGYKLLKVCGGACKKTSVVHTESDCAVGGGHRFPRMIRVEYMISNMLWS